jgi:hypothetical protein
MTEMFVHMKVEAAELEEEEEEEELLQTEYHLPAVLTAGVISAAAAADKELVAAEEGVSHGGVEEQQTDSRGSVIKREVEDWSSPAFDSGGGLAAMDKTEEQRYYDIGT